MSVKERYIIGVDLGGTNIVAGAMPLDGSREIAMRTTPTQAEGGAGGVVERIVGMIEQVIAQTIAETGAERSDFLGVGVGSPGPLDRENGIVIVSPNLGWKNFPLRDEIAKRVKLESTLDNDANCATLGEFWCGAAVGGRNVVGVTLGTGIGGGLILEGKLYHGASDVAGEIGHTPSTPPAAAANAQLRLPRGLRFGSRHRRARARGAAWRRRRIDHPWHGGRGPKENNRTDRVRGLEAR